MFSKLALLGLLGLAAAAPAPALVAEKLESSLVARSFDCSNPVSGLSYDDCVHMSNIGMAGQGDNINYNNGNIWIGTDGPNRFTFTNNAGVPITVIVWDFTAGDYEASFMNVRRSKISYSILDGESIDVSLANGVSGGFAALYNRITTLSQWGQVWNTWGEFTTGDYATIDVSREVNGHGNAMSINVNNGVCVSDFTRCYFACKNGADSCTDSGSYDLFNCEIGSQPGANKGYYGVDPSGGCSGWSNGGSLAITFSN